MTRPEPVQVGLVWLFTTEINFIPLLFHKRGGDNVANLSVAYLPYPFEQTLLLRFNPNAWFFHFQSGVERKFQDEVPSGKETDVYIAELEWDFAKDEE